MLLGILLVITGTYHQISTKKIARCWTLLPPIGKRIITIDILNEHMVVPCFSRVMFTYILPIQVRKT